MTEAAEKQSEAERLERLADRCELAMIDAIERALKAEVGPVRTNARTAASEFAIVAGMIRDRMARLNVAQAVFDLEAPEAKP
jgi:hypothetical protein